MKLRNLIPFVLLPVLATSGCSAETQADSEMFIAMIMTKNQQSSSIPTDSGILIHSKSSGEWERLGPAIQMISSVTADPSNPDILFLACGNGVVRSRNGGETWRMVTGWKESDVLQIAIDPTNGNRIYAATAWGVTISTDGGESWNMANEGLDEYFSKSIVIDARDPSRLLLANTRGLFESTNQAATWARIDAVPEVAILRLRRGVSNPDVWIAATEGRGIYISHDDAVSWKPVAPELSQANVYGVAVDPHDSTNLAAGGWDTGVHVSIDGGTTWQQAADLVSPHVTVVCFDANVPGRLWASTFEEGTYFSDDMGRTWTSADLDGAYVFDIGFLPVRQ
ncbi:MAG: WD40/YVTN/BNR-like repeat-containing protein [Puniceicoccaceae bacterium]